MTEPKGARARYKTTNWAEYNVALKTQWSPTISPDTDMQWNIPASGQRSAVGRRLGRQHIFCDPAIQLCLSIKCQKTLRVQLPYRASTTALDLLVASTGIKFLGEGEWKRKKHEVEYRRQWRKVPRPEAYSPECSTMEGEPGGRARAQ